MKTGFLKNHWAKSPKKKSVGVHFWQHGTVIRIYKNALLQTVFFGDFSHWLFQKIYTFYVCEKQNIDQNVYEVIWNHGSRVNTITNFSAQSYAYGKRKTYILGITCAQLFAHVGGSDSGKYRPWFICVATENVTTPINAQIAKKQNKQHMKQQ